MYKDENDVDRFGCFACDAFGDVIDFVKKIESLDFSKAIDRCNILIKELEGTHWRPTVLESSRETLDFTEDINVATSNSLEPFFDMAFDRKWPIDPEYIAEAFSIGCIGNRVIIPFYDDDICVGYKIRQGSEKLSAPGSKFRTFYGSWLDRGEQNVVLTEGEPDTWVAYSRLHNWAVLGLPTGAASPAKNLETLQGRDVVLAFDGDDAGRAATRKWVEALKGLAASVRVVSMPDGYDLAMLSDVREAVENAQPLLPYTGNIFLRNGLFQRAITGKDGTTYEFISNWGFTPRKELKGAEGGVAYEGMVTPSGVSVVITSEDLSSSNNAHRWSQHHGLGWRGSDKDARDILIWLESQGAYLAQGNMTRVLGLHDRHFVLPDRTIGEEDWVFVPKPGIVTKHLDYGQYDNVQDVLAWCRKLHLPSVVDPAMAWMFAAPLRSMFEEFPVLNIFGSSSAGKTTFTRTMIRSLMGGALGGPEGIALAATSPHAMLEHAGATNAMAVWFDDFRASVPYLNQTALKNTVLAAYNAQLTSKGSVTSMGLGTDTWETIAPFVITGENTFEETAHVERMVTIPLPITGRNPNALRHLQTLSPSGVADAYLTWLIYEADLDFRVRPAYELDLPSRVQTNIGVLRVGWSLMRDFMTFMEMDDPGDPDFSLIIQEAKNVAAEDPIVEAIKWAIESSPYIFERLAVVKDNQVYVRIEPLVAAVRKDNRFPLPGNAKAVKRLLEEKYGAYELSTALPDHGITQSMRFLVVDQEKLGW
jgi:hypothetical protein